MKKLNHEEQVKFTGMKYRTEIYVGTIEGCARKDGEDIQASIELEMRNAKKNYVEPSLAWTNAAGAELVGEFEGREEWLAKKQARFNAATILENGEKVEIEGRLYTVKIHPRAEFISDPIHFMPVK